MSNPTLAFVLLENPITPDMSALTRALRLRHPELAEQMASDDGADARQGPTSSPLIRCGGELVAVMSMPAAIPGDPGLWSRTAATWPEGKTVAARHQGHLIVSVLGKNRQPLPAARLTTAVVGALISIVPECCAVVWGAKVARPAELWLEMSSRSFAPFPEYPFTLWLDVLPFRSGRKIGAVTTGLLAFTGREIEFETDRLTLSALIEKVAGLAVYLIEHGGVVKDGDTVGQDERERFTVRHKTSDRFAGLPVLFCAAD